MPAAAEAKEFGIALSSKICGGVVLLTGLFEPSPAVLVFVVTGCLGLAMLWHMRHGPRVSPF